MQKKTFIFLATLVVLTACKSFKDWDQMYKDQQKLFKKNRQTFELAANTLNSLPVNDTTLSIKDKHLPFPDTLVHKLRDIGISQVSIYRYDCETKDIRFVPDSLWEIESFSVVEIIYCECDERNRNGYHWMMEASEHKHSFGQGQGWFIYSDSDRDPF